MANFIWYAECKKPYQSSAYEEVLRKRVQASMPSVTITKIEKITNNRFLHAAFQLKNAEFRAKCGMDCRTEELYHATAACNVPSIVKNNLDWRKVTRSKYGIGVSFSDDPNYANKYCNNKNGPNRALIVCEVLIGSQCKVSDNHDLYPLYDADSYRSVTNRVLVKFQDNTFYPKYVIYYNTGFSNNHIRSIRYDNFDSDDDDYFNDLMHNIIGGLENFNFNMY